MLRRSPVELPDTGSAATPSVGIFFGAMLKAAPFILHEATPLAEAEDYDLCKTHPRGHYQAWEASRAALALQGEYDDYPRGRLVFDARRLHFIVYLDRGLDVPVFRRAILHYFAIPADGTVSRHDAHYARVRHRMRFETR